MSGGNGTAEKLEGMLSGDQYEGAAKTQSRLPQDYQTETPADVAAKKKSQRQASIDGNQLLASTEDACEELDSDITGNAPKNKDPTILDLVLEQENEIYTSQKAEVDMEYIRQKNAWDTEKEARQYRGVVKAYHWALQVLGFEKVPTEEEFTADKKQIARYLLNAKIDVLGQQKEDLAEQAKEVTKEKRSLHEVIRKIDRKSRTLYNNLPLLETKIGECETKLGEYDDRLSSLAMSDDNIESVDATRTNLEEEADGKLAEMHAYEDARIQAKDKLKRARVKIEYQQARIAEVEAFEQIVYEEKDAFERELDKLYILANEKGSSSIGKTLRVLATAEEMKGKMGSLINTSREKWISYINGRKRCDTDKQVEDIRKGAKPFHDYTEKNKDSDANTLAFFGTRYNKATKA